LWLKSKREETEVQKSREKGKQREEKIVRAEDVEEGNSSFSPVAYSVSTRIL